MNRNETNRFATNPINLDISRSTFNRDHKVLFSFNVGDCIPFYLDEILPGDTFSVDTSKVVRLQPLVTPIMDNIYLDTYYFYVPIRLLWDHWKEFNGENTQTAWVPQVTYTIPQLVIPSGGFDTGTIADYLGVPTKTGAGKKISALPFRAVAKIMDDWFRDENLMNPVHLTTGDSDINGSNGSDQVTDIEKGGKPFIACKYFDYFTACLPGAQKAAGPSVSFALNGLIPVLPMFNKDAWNGDGYISNTNYSPMTFKEASIRSTGTVGSLSNVATFNPSANENTNLFVDDDNYLYGEHPFNSNQQSTTSVPLVPKNLFADFSNYTVFDINQLRTAFAIQRFYEKQARGGSRYIEYIKAFFNVDSPDARLQRSEYLGGNRLPLNVSSVEQTSASETGLTPQGNLTGISATGDVHSDFTKSFTEHGYVIGICVARYHHTYQQGIERHWLRKTLFDYYNPTFANLGEQGVKTWEIYFDGSIDEDSIFGYQEAWADYRYKPSRVAGEMRSNANTPLDSWHLADNYNSQPYLSDSWIREDKTMLDRCLAVTSSVSNQLIADFYIQCQATRPMPLYSIPGLIDHH